MKTLLLLLLCIIVLVIGIINNTMKLLTTRRFIITNYMYIFVGFLLFLITGEYLDNNNFDIIKIGERLLPLFILTIILLFGILMTPPQYQSIKHLYWLGFIILLSVSGYPMYKIAKQEKIIYRVLISLAVIFIVMSQIKTDSDNYMPYMMACLLSLIVFQSLDLIFGSREGITKRFWYYSIFGIVLFSGFLIYDTNRMVRISKYLEKTCNKTHLVCADYPEKSLGILMDLLNLFNQLTYVYRKN